MAGGESKPPSDKPRKAANPTNNKLNSLPNHQQSNQALSKLATTYKTGTNHSRAANASNFVTSPPQQGEEGSSRVSLHDPPPPAAQSRHPSQKSASRLWKKAKVRAPPVLLIALRISEYSFGICLKVVMLDRLDISVW